MVDLAEFVCKQGVKIQKGFDFGLYCAARMKAKQKIKSIHGAYILFVLGAGVDFCGISVVNCVLFGSLCILFSRKDL